jgi:hypothetical protein
VRLTVGWSGFGREQHEGARGKQPVKHGANRTDSQFAPAPARGYFRVHAAQYSALTGVAATATVARREPPKQTSLKGVLKAAVPGSRGRSGALRGIAKRLDRPSWRADGNGCIMRGSHIQVEIIWRSIRPRAPCPAPSEPRAQPARKANETCGQRWRGRGIDRPSHGVRVLRRFWRASGWGGDRASGSRTSALPR